MGGVGDFLLGDSDDAKQTGTAETLTPGQKKLLDQLSGMLGEQLGQGVEGYSGTTTTGPTGIQQSVFDKMQGLLGSNPQQNQTSLSAIEKLMAGTDPSSIQQQQVAGYDVGEFDPAAAQAWYQNALVDPAMKNWEQNIAPAVQEKFISNNAGSSGAGNRAIASSAADMMTGLNSQLANALYGEKQGFDANKFTAGMAQTGAQNTANANYTNNVFNAGQADLSRTAQVPGLANATQQQPFDQLMAMLTQGQNVGGTQYGINQAQAQGDYNQWLSQQAYNNPWLNLLPSTLGTSAFSPIVQGPTQSQGFLQSILGAAGGTDFSNFG